MRFNSVEINQESILKTRLHFAEIYQRCIDGAKNKDFYVNDLEGYILSEEAKISEVMQGDYDHTLTFMQRAYYLQEGEMIALLPK